MVLATITNIPLVIILLVLQQQRLGGWSSLLPSLAALACLLSGGVCLIWSLLLLRKAPTKPDFLLWAFAASLLAICLCVVILRTLSQDAHAYSRQLMS